MGYALASAILAPVVLLQGRRVRCVTSPDCAMPSSGRA
jgi:hypothetical protein